MKKQHRQKLTVRVTPQTAYNLERLMTMSGRKRRAASLTSWFVKKCLPCAGIPEKRRTTDEIRLWKARVGRNGALPAGNGRIGRVRGMHMGQRTGGSTMTAGSVIVLAFWVIFTVRKHFTPKLAAAEKANTYDLNRDNPEAKRPHSAAVGRWRRQDGPCV